LSETLAGSAEPLGPFSSFSELETVPSPGWGGSTGVMQVKRGALVAK